MGFDSMSGDGIISSWGEMANGGLMMLIWVVLIIVLITVAVAWISRLFQRNSGKDDGDNLNQPQARHKADADDAD